MKNILHITDLHLNQSNRSDVKVLLSPLIDDIERCIQKHGCRPSSILITGDLVRSADEDSAYNIFFDEVIFPLSEVTGVIHEDFIFCPGNHDAHQKFVNDRFELQKYIRDESDNDDKLNMVFRNRANELESEKFYAYNEFRSTFLTENDTVGFGYVVRNNHNLKVSIISLNTALLTCAGLTDEYGTDLRKLSIPESTLLEAFKNIRYKQNTILLTHHPFEWLTESSEKLVRQVIRSNNKSGKIIHLYGHMHDFSPLNTFGTGGEILKIQGGALYQGRGRKNSYSFLAAIFQPDHERIISRAFNEDRREFVPDIDISDDGVFSPVKKNTTNLNRGNSDAEVLNNWMLDNYRPELSSDFNDGMTDRPIDEVFTPQPLVTKGRWREGVEETNDRNEKDVSIKDIVDSSSHFIIHGDPEFGKTKLLQKICIDIIEPGQSVPVYIEYTEIKNRHNHVFRCIKQKLSSVNCCENLEKILSDGRIVLCVDDVNPQNGSTFSKLRQFVEKYHNNRFIFTLDSQINSSLAEAFEGEFSPTLDVKIVFEHVSIKPMRRKDVRQLVAKWKQVPIKAQNELVEKMTRELSDMNLPWTAANGTIFLSILEGDAASRSVNKANLINRYIDYVLEKRSPLEVYRGRFDFDNKVMVLSKIARWMVTISSYTVGKNKLVKQINRILDNYALSFPAEAIVENFIQAKILRENADGEIGFRYRVFLEYFVAEEMVREEEFRAVILDPENILRFRYEVQLYASLKRNDNYLLNLLHDLNLQVFNEVQDNMGWTVKLHDLDSFVAPREDSPEEMYQSLEHQISSPRLSPSERDSFLDSETPRNTGVSQEVIRPIFSHKGQEWLVAVLLYSAVLKESEHISKHEKSHHLSVILNSWGAFVAQTFLIIPGLSEKRKLKINGLVYEINAPKSWSNSKVARFLFFDTPNSIGRMMSRTMGTPKLISILDKPTILEGSEPNIIRYLREFLVFQNMGDGWLPALKGSFDQYSCGSFFYECLLNLGARLHKLASLEDKEVDELGKLLALKVGEMRGDTITEKNRIASKAIERFNRQHYLNRMQITAEERGD